MSDGPKPNPVRPKQVFMGYAFDGTQRAQAHPYCPACGNVRTEGDSPCAEQCPSCGHRAFRNPYPGVCVLVVHDGRFLLVRRRERSFRGGMWCLPQGYVEYHEDFLSAARREVREETGVDIHVTGLLSVTSNFLDPAHHSLGVVLLGELVDRAATLTAGDDASEVAWFSSDAALPGMAFESDTHILERLRAGTLVPAPIDADLGQWR
jgi:8-oxo-dGTP diphosphatase